LSILDNLIANPPDNINQISTDLESISELIKSIEDLHDSISGSHPEIVDLPKELLDALLLLYLYNRFPVIYHSLELIGIIENTTEEFSTEGGIVTHQKNKLPKFFSNRISEFLSNPLSLISEKYWPNGLNDLNTASLAGISVFYKLSLVLKHLNVETFVGKTDGPALYDAHC
jgi:hypothetical protein